MLRFRTSFHEIMRSTAYGLIRFIIFFVLAAFYFPSHGLMASTFAAKEVNEPSSFQLQPGSRLKIVVYREADLSGEYEIDPAGNLSFPLIGDIKTAGLKIEQLSEQLTVKLKKFLINPQVSISRSEGTIKSISVLGHITKPGIYDYTPGSTLMRLISTAGGFAESANKKKIKIVRIIDGDKKVMIVNATDIINGQANDPNIESGDIIFVPESIF